MNEEEKKAINDFKRTVELYEAKPIDKISVKFDEFDYKIVKIVLNLIEKLQKENEELKADNYELNNRITDLLENIPIQKVKDKIKELNSRIEIYWKYVQQGIETDVEWVDNVADRETVKILQELIEEREEK